MANIEPGNRPSNTKLKRIHRKKAPSAQAAHRPQSDQPTQPSRIISRKNVEFESKEWEDFRRPTGSNSERADYNVSFLTLQGAESLFCQQRQFVIGHTTDELNMKEIRIATCDAKRAQRGQLISLSILGGFLAAQSMKLSTCQRLISDGELLMVQDCHESQVEVQIIKTKCGPQPIYIDENNITYSIAKNGFQLIPYSPCIHQNPIMNLNGKFYMHINNELVEQKPSLHINSFQVIDHFDTIPLIQYDIASHFINRYDHYTNERLEVLSQFVSSLRESGTESLNGLIFEHQTKNNIVTTFSWFDYIYYTLIAIGIFIFFTIIIRLYNCINPNPTFRKFFSSCCKCCSKKENPPSVEMKPLQKILKKKKTAHEHKNIHFVDGIAYWADGCRVAEQPPHTHISRHQLAPQPEGTGPIDQEKKKNLDFF